MFNTQKQIEMSRYITCKNKQVCLLCPLITSALGQRSPSHCLRQQRRLWCGHINVKYQIRPLCAYRGCLDSSQRQYLQHSRFLHQSVSAADKYQSNPATSGSHGYIIKCDRNTHVPSSSQVVICGGGIVGLSVAYHLTQLGWTDVVLLERNSLTSGTTWHAAGVVCRLRESKVEYHVFNYSANLYKQLQEQGYDTGWREIGSVMLAKSKDRMHSLKHLLSINKARKFDAGFITLREAKNMIPLLNVEDLEGMLYSPTDGCASSTAICSALSQLSTQAGARIFEQCEVIEVMCEHDAVAGVRTSHGDIRADYFVNCAGLWAREVGKRSKPRVGVPIHAVEHYNLITKPITGVHPGMPVIIDGDGGIYIREVNNGGLCAGGFEPRAKPVFHEHIPHDPYKLLTSDWDHFNILLEQMLHRLPALGSAHVDQLLCGPASFTPDGRWIMGETPEIRNYYTLAGMNAHGVHIAGGAGKLLAEWIVDGFPSMNTWPVDRTRFSSLHNNKKYLRDRVRETVGRVYRVSYPYQEFESARRPRMSPLHTRLQSQGAVFEQHMGFERSAWFDDEQQRYLEFYDEDLEEPSSVPGHDSSGLGSGQSSSGTFGKPRWFNAVRDEYFACREGVCLIDMSSFTKYELKSSGSEVVNALQYVCSNNVDVPVGTVIHTGIQNQLGGYHGDCSIFRLAHNHYFLIAPTVLQVRLAQWFRRHFPQAPSVGRGDVTVNDVTSKYSAINVIGAKSVELMSELTETPMSPDEFPSFKCKEIDVGYATNVMAVSVTHAAELGYVLYIPNEYALHVYDRLMISGKNYGVRNAGYYALRALRVEKLFAFWGLDLHDFTTPLECGRAFRVDFGKKEFIGKEALMKQKAEGTRKRLVQFLLEDFHIYDEVWPFIHEPIYRNDVFVGTTTSSAYGYTLGCKVCLGFVRNPDEVTGEDDIVTNDYLLDKDAKYEIEVSGKRYASKIRIHSPKLKSLTEQPYLYYPTRDY